MVIVGFALVITRLWNCLERSHIHRQSKRLLSALNINGRPIFIYLLFRFFFLLQGQVDENTTFYLF